MLYPDDSTEAGRALRFLQQYFMVSCSLQDIITRFRKNDGTNWSALPDRVAIQMNDTHPALSVAELMRILLDQAQLPWDQAWDITLRTLAYTNHTLLPEALERWPVEFFEVLIPRHLEIVYEINRRFLDDVRRRYPGDEARVQRMSLIEEGPVRKVRMAHLAVVGSHSTNGVAAIHSDLLRTHVLRDFAELFPERFNNKTNGVTPRRWLQQANPALSALITKAIGDDWVTDLAQLRKLLPLADDAGFREQFRDAKREAKVAFANWLKATSGQIVDPDTIFDSQIKRIHEYKRQLLNVLHIIILYNRLRSNPNQDVTPRTFFFAGKAAPAYQSGQADHQADQQRRRHDQRRSGGAWPAQGAVPAGVQRQHGRAAHPGQRRLRADLDRRLRSQRHRQHEIHDERRARPSAPATGPPSKWPRKPARRTSSSSA